MSRLIDADKLMEEIRSYRMTVTGLRAGKGVLNEYMRHFIEGILKIIDEQPTVNEWIPADEPPKTDEYILLSFENFSVPLVGMYRDDGDGGAYYIGDDEESCISQNIIVNAWMPVPELYGAERSNT